MKRPCKYRAQLYTVPVPICVLRSHAPGAEPLRYELSPLCSEINQGNLHFPCAGKPATSLHAYPVGTACCGKPFPHAKTRTV